MNRTSHQLAKNIEINNLYFINLNNPNEISKIVYGDSKKILHIFTTILPSL